MHARGGCTLCTSALWYPFSKANERACFCFYAGQQAGKDLRIIPIVMRMALKGVGKETHPVIAEHFDKPIKSSFVLNR